jgi:hypothetical protein
MKKIILKFVLPIVLPLLAVIAIGPGCGPGPGTPTTCPTGVPSGFINLYNSFGTDLYSMDFETYEYTFTTTTAGNICAVGYQGHVNLASLAAYKIEILDGTTVLSTGTYTCSNLALDYKTITPVAISAGHTYTVRRKVINIAGDVGNTISHYKALPGGTFTPITFGAITITGTKLYEQYALAAPYNIQTNTALGCIDIVMQ